MPVRASSVAVTVQLEVTLAQALILCRVRATHGRVDSNPLLPKAPMARMAEEAVAAAEEILAEPLQEFLTSR